jgi:purine-nucleoside phosphorylase
MPISPSTTAAKLRRLSPLRPTLAIILGSGFKEAVAHLQPDAEIDYPRLPGFPPVGVEGHTGKLFIGRLGRSPAVILSGRAHFYEGHPMSLVTFAVRALAAYGITDLLLTNAAGGINPRFRPGDFMLLTDHINLMGANPLSGAPIAGLPRFVDMSQAYDPGLGKLVRQAAHKAGLKLHAGVYLAVSGPTYETPAEVRAFGRLGADAVGMSTVPEAIVARQLGLRVAGLSCITNAAAGLGKGKLDHVDDVLKTAERIKAPAAKMLEIFAQLYGQSQS